MSLAQAGDDIAARAAFVDALRLDDTIVLPEDAPPSLRPVFADARASALAAGPPVAPSAAAPAPPPTAKSAPVLEEEKQLPLPAVVGAAVAGVGVLVVGAGGGLGLMAMGQAEEARKERFQQDAIAGFEAASATAVTANVLFVVGGAAILGGAAAAVVTPFLE